MSAIPSKIQTAAIAAIRTALETAVEHSKAERGVLGKAIAAAYKARSFDADKAAAFVGQSGDMAGADARELWLADTAAEYMPKLATMKAELAKLESDEPGTDATSAKGKARAMRADIKAAKVMLGRIVRGVVGLSTPNREGKQVTGVKVRNDGQFQLSFDGSDDVILSANQVIGRAPGANKGGTTAEEKADALEMRDLARSLSRRVNALIAENSRYATAAKGNETAEELATLWRVLNIYMAGTDAGMRWDTAEELHVADAA